MAAARLVGLVFPKEKGFWFGACDRSNRGSWEIPTRIYQRRFKGLSEISSPSDKLRANLQSFSVTIKREDDSSRMAPPVTYRYLTTSLAGFIQQLAVSYLNHGYWYYVFGRIPEHKDPFKTDEKIIEQYGLRISKYTRCRRKKAGTAGVQYLRYERFYVIVATRGRHAFIEQEIGQIKDVRETPVRIEGYSVSYRQARGGNTWHPSVRLELDRYQELTAYFLELALRRTENEILRKFIELKLLLYAPVVDQQQRILRKVNAKRAKAGLPRVPVEGLPWRRKPVRPFAWGRAATCPSASAQLCEVPRKEGSLTPTQFSPGYPDSEFSSLVPCTRSSVGKRPRERRVRSSRGCALASPL